MEECNNSSEWYLLSKSQTSSQTSPPQDKDSESDDELTTKVNKKLSNFLSSYHLTKFSTQIALSWLTKMSNDKTNDLNRVKSYVLRSLNNDRSKLPNISAWQKGCPEIIPGLRSHAVWDTSLFLFVKMMEENYDVIKEELLGIRNVGDGDKSGFQPYRSPKSDTASINEDEIGQKSTSSGNWNVFYLSLHNLPFPENTEKCPKTVELLNSIPSQYHHSFFSALSPGTNITPHNGPTNKKLRCHLPLIVDGSSATMRVGEEKVVIEQGKCIIFDDSFRHSASNSSVDHSRITLIFDVWHPDLTIQEIKFLNFLQVQSLKWSKKVCEESGNGDNFFSVIDKARDVVNDGLDDEVWS